MLNPAVKADVLKVESVFQMRHELQDAFFRALFQGKIKIIIQCINMKHLFLYPFY